MFGGNEMPAQLVTLTDASHSMGAVCLDGSPAAYYLRKGWGSGATKWLIYLEGGGWCTSLDDCVSRAGTSQGSTTTWAAAANLSEWGNELSPLPQVNPMMYNWNTVLIGSCDGGGYSSSKDTPSVHNGTSLHFRGKAIIDAVRVDILAKGLNNGTDVVISGCSCGGLATYLTIDNWAAALETSSRRVVGLPDSGFFLDFDGPPGVPQTFKAGMEWVFQYMNCSAGVNQQCIAHHGRTGDLTKCFFAEHTAPFIKTPVFALQSEYDSAQLGMILGSTDPNLVNAWGQNVTRLVKQTLLAHNKQHGVFLDSCSHHCGSWGHLYVGPNNQPTAFQDWYAKGSPAMKNQGYYSQSKAYPCKTCGCDVDSSDSVLV